MHFFLLIKLITFCSQEIFGPPYFGFKFFFQIPKFFKVKIKFSNRCAEIRISDLLPHPACIVSIHLASLSQDTGIFFYSLFHMKKIFLKIDRIKKFSYRTILWYSWYSSRKCLRKTYYVKSSKERCWHCFEWRRWSISGTVPLFSKKRNIKLPLKLFMFLLFTSLQKNSIYIF